MLQTPDYMRALFRHGRFSDSDVGMDRGVEARVARQEVLDSEAAPKY
ncbi:Scr1 family TA system antitoxin-like transcriptional regulator [Streptomyces sp. RKAG337]